VAGPANQNPFSGQDDTATLLNITNDKTCNLQLKIKYALYSM